MRRRNFFKAAFGSLLGAAIVPAPAEQIIGLDAGGADDGYGYTLDTKYGEVRVCGLIQRRYLTVAEVRLLDGHLAMTA